jgi:hypothetical protein
MLISLRRMLKSVGVETRVARWHIFKQKIPILGKFWRIFLWKMLAYFMAVWSIFVAIWSILLLLGLFYSYVHIWYIFAILVCCTKKNLATLDETNYRLLFIYVSKTSLCTAVQGCQMVYSHTKIPICMYIFWRALEWNIL